jgi:hypothetical protein
MGERRPRTARPRRKRSRLRLLLIGALVLLVYPVFGTLVLWSGLAEKWIESEDLRVELDKPAYTIFPGRVHLKGARIFSNSETQFVLSAEDMSFEVRLLGLLRKKIYVASVLGENVRFQMRVQVASTEGIEERVAAYPKLEGLPGVNTVLLDKAEKAEEQKEAFTVQVEGIDVKLAELWFFEYRYLGPGALQGGFIVGPGIMRVDTSVQEVGPGELRFGPDQVLAEHVRGRIEAEIPELDPEAHADESFLELVTARIHLAADVRSLEHLRAYLGGMAVKGGAGPFEAKVSMQEGRLGADSRITFGTEDVSLFGKGFSVRSDWDFDAHVRAEQPEDRTARAERSTTPDVLPRIRSTSKATYVSFVSERTEDVFTVQVRKHEEGAVLETTELGTMTDIAHAYVRMPEIVTADLADLSVLTDEGSPFVARKGTARASLFLDIDENHVVRGPFKARFEGAQLTVDDIQIYANGSASCRIHSELDHETTTLSDISLSISDLKMRAGDQQVEDWWMRLSSKKLEAWGLPPERTQTQFSVRAKSAEPVLKALVAKGELSKLVPTLTHLNDLRIEAEVRKHGSVTDVLLEPLETNLFDVAGRFHMSDAQNRMAIVLGGKAISLGIASDASGLTLAPMARTGWLNQRLKGFPEPIDQVSPSQP